MSTISWNRTDSTATAVGSLKPDTLNYAADFAKRASDTASLTIANLTGPADRVETIKYAYNRVANVYTGSTIDPSAFAQSKAGASVLVQVNDIVSVTDDKTNMRVDLPLQAHVVVKVPLHEAVTSDVLDKLFARLVGACYEQSGTTPGPRLSALIRGAVTPKTLV